MWPGTLIYMHFTSLAYALEKYAFHITHTIHVPLHYYCGLHIDLQYWTYMFKKTTNCNFEVVYFCNTYIPETDMPSNTTYPDIWPLYHYIFFLWIQCNQQCGYKHWEMQQCNWWHHQHHVTRHILLLCTYQKLICPSNATYKPQIPISSCAHMSASYIPNGMNNVIMNTDIHTFTLLAYAPEIYIPHCPYMFYCTSVVYI